MSSSFCTAYFKEYQVVNIKKLEGSSISIDIMPFLYKNLFNGSTSKDAPLLKSEKNIVTSYISGFLKLVSWFKKNNIDVVVCIDGERHNPIKDQTIRKRIEQRKLNVQRLKEKRSFYTEEDFSKLLEKAQAYIGLQQKKRIISLCEVLGLKYYFQDFVEGEKACTQLKKQGLVDHTLTPDGDAYLFGVDFFSHADIHKNELIYRNYSKNLQAVSSRLGPQNLTLCIVVTGCDYTKGIYGLGPKKTLSLLHKDEELLRRKAFTQIANYDEICRYINEKIDVDKCCVPIKDPLCLEKLLTQWNFSNSTISKYLNLFFK